jgi:enediyne biosynthesis protein E4
MVKNVIKNPDGSPRKWTAYSHSGNERNRTFLNQKGRSFMNISPVSGSDLIQDSRSFVTLDFNRDGRQDIAVVNANRPKLQMLKNMMEADANGFIAIRLIGGNQLSGPSDGYSNRDGIGARILVETESGKILRVLSAGEGFASQNSKTIIVGLGRAGCAKRISVTWPSGRVTEGGGFQSGSLLKISELEGVVIVKPYLAE